MYAKFIQPIRDKDAYSKYLEQTLAYELFQLLYKPLLNLLDPAESRENAPVSPLVQAFVSGTIHFSEGFVYGKFNAGISKALKLLGATFNIPKKAFKISLSSFPPDIRAAISRGSVVESEAISKMRKKLQELTDNNIIIPNTVDVAKSTLADLHKQFEKLTPKDLEIPVEMHGAMEEKMIASYTANVYDEIEDLGADAIYRMRQRVEDAVGQGIRAKGLKKILMSEYGVTANRAKFVARQETSLFVAKYRQVRYEEAGLNQYQWSTSSDLRVREDHKELNGRIFSWDSPPITDKATGARNNPGEDFGCRCVALPVIMKPGSSTKRPLYDTEISGINLLESDEHIALHNAKVIKVDLKPAEYLELVQQGFGYPTMQHLFATMLPEKVEAIRRQIRMGTVVAGPTLEYKWTGKRILFWQDGRHRAMASLDEGVESISCTVTVPDAELEEAIDIMPTWFVEKLKLEVLV